MSRTFFATLIIINKEAFFSGDDLRGSFEVVFHHFESIVTVIHRPHVRKELGLHVVKEMLTPHFLERDESLVLHYVQNDLLTVRDESVVCDSVK